MTNGCLAYSTREVSVSWIKLNFDNTKLFKRADLSHGKKTWIKIVRKTKSEPICLYICLCANNALSFHIILLFTKHFIFFIDSGITVVLIFTPLPPSNPNHLLRKAIPWPSLMSMGHACKFFGYYISYTILYIPMDIL